MISNNTIATSSDLHAALVITAVWLAVSMWMVQSEAPTAPDGVLRAGLFFLVVSVVLLTLVVLLGLASWPVAILIQAGFATVTMLFGKSPHRRRMRLIKAVAVLLSGAACAGFIHVLLSMAR